MPVDLAELADPRHTALLIMEMQRGVVGDIARFPELASACADRDVIGNLASLAKTARSAGVPVVHCTAAFRPDRAGTHTGNSPFIRQIPLRRIGRPEDVAGIVAFLCTDRGGHITGQTVSVSGGITMH